MLQGAVIACLGKQVARGLAFPLFYALFLVPVGEELVPLMQTVTAEMSMGLLWLTGVPAHIEGIFITTPTGYFEVAEACSGVKFLIAMAAFGALVANVCFRSWPRRLAFVAVSLLVPILANGVRAWRHHLCRPPDRSVDFAAGFDHVVYGWIFFAIVIALILGVGLALLRSRRERALVRSEGAAARGAQGARLDAVVGGDRRPRRRAGRLAGRWSARAAPSRSRPRSRCRDVAGWGRAGERRRALAAAFAGADRIAHRPLSRRAGAEVDLAIAVFARQSEGRELVGFGQGAVAAETAPGRGPANARRAGGRTRGADRLARAGARGGQLLPGRRRADRERAEVKLETMQVRLLGGPQRAVAVLVSAEAPRRGRQRRGRRSTLSSRALGPVERLADRAAGLE